MEIRYSRGGLLGWIQERWFEFRQGHGTYLGFILSFVNFVLISYSLFLEKIFRDLTLLSLITHVITDHIFVHTPKLFSTLMNLDSGMQ